MLLFDRILCQFLRLSVLDEHMRLLFRQVVAHYGSVRELQKLYKNSLNFLLNRKSAFKTRWINLIFVPKGHLESPPAQHTDLDAYHYWERPYADAIINLPIKISQAVDKTHCASQGQGRLSKHFNESQ
jgi:hypothetical protein